MRTILGLIGLLLLSLQGWAQLANPSFEQTDSTGAIANWQSLQGKTTRVTVEQFGILPFTAFHGNYFIKLESDTNPIKVARFTQTFAFADTPASFYLHHLYLPENTNQTAGVQLLMTKWNGTSRDTVLFIRDSVHVVANGSQVPIQWNTFGTNLSNRYLLAQLPDTATIELTNDLTATGTQIKWYVDALSFGQQVDVSIETLSDNTYQIHTQSLPNGLYLLHSLNDPNIHQLICIQH
jgi:hypothetical protein